MWNDVRMDLLIGTTLICMSIFNIGPESFKGLSIEEGPGNNWSLKPFSYQELNVFISSRDTSIQFSKLC